MGINYLDIAYLLFSWLPNVVDFAIETGEALSRPHPASLAKFFPLWTIEVIFLLQGINKVKYIKGS